MYRFSEVIMLRQFMMYLIGAFGFLAFFILGMVLLTKEADQTKPWVRTYSKGSIPDGYQLKMEVKGKPLGIDYFLLVTGLLFTIAMFITGSWDLIIICMVVLVFIYILYFRCPTRYICYLYSDSILIGIMDMPKALNDYIIKIPFGEIVSIDNKKSPGQFFKTSYLSTFSFQLIRYRTIYILCQHENKQRYFKIRVTDEILKRLRRDLTDREIRMERIKP